MGEVLKLLTTYHTVRVVEAYTGRELNRSVVISPDRVAEVRFLVGELPVVYLETENSDRWLRSQKSGL